MVQVDILSDTMRRFSMSQPALFGCVACLAAVSTLSATDLRLVDAAKANDRKAVIALIAAKADVNASQPGGATPLIWAAERSDDEMASRLLAAGAKPDTANVYGETPLT